MAYDLGSYRGGLRIVQLGAFGRTEEQTVKAAPCKNCERRTVKPNCHAKCQEYKDYVIERQQMYKKRAEESEIYEALADKAYRLIKKR